MDEFKIGDRVFFIENHGLGVFGNVASIADDGTRLIVRADGIQLYDVLIDNATKISGKLD